MPRLYCDLEGTRHSFASLRMVVAAASIKQRVTARFSPVDLPLTTFLDESIVAYEDDEITRLIIDRHDSAEFSRIARHTVGWFREQVRTRWRGIGVWRDGVRVLATWRPD